MRDNTTTKRSSVFPRGGGSTGQKMMMTTTTRRKLMPVSLVLSSIVVFLMTMMMVLLLPSVVLVVDGRPLMGLQEQKQAYWISYCKGMVVGYEDLLSLLGYYEEDDVKANLASMDVKNELKKSQSIERDNEDDDDHDDDDDDDDNNKNNVYGRNENNKELWYVDPEWEQDVTEIKVVGLGLGRTGTTSVVQALELLGYAVVHDDEQPELTDLYAARAQHLIDNDDFHEILGLRGYNATFKTADLEWVVETIEDDDDVVIKSILTVRDNADKYVDSWLAAAPFYEMMFLRPFKWMTTVQHLLPSLEYEYKSEPTLGDPDKWLDRQTLKDSYETYNQNVAESIPADRLLIFNVKQGWEPLCTYLNHPIPDGIPFPHVHTRAKIDGEMAFLRLITWIWPVAIIMPSLVVFYLLRMIVRRCCYRDTENTKNKKKNKKTE